MTLFVHWVLAAATSLALVGVGVILGAPFAAVCVLAALGFVAGYGLGYVVAVLRGRAWMAGIRQTNVVMALAMAGLAALTMTPVLDGERLSANGQMRRALALAEKGEVADLRALGRWGRAAPGR